MTDFEIAAMDAFRVTYPNSTITGCYFHLCQSVLRKTQQLGLCTLYDTNDEVRGSVEVWNSLPRNVDFSTLTSFKRSIQTVDFTEFLRCAS